MISKSILRHISLSGAYISVRHWNLFYLCCSRAAAIIGDCELLWLLLAQIGLEMGNILVGGGPLLRVVDDHLYYLLFLYTHIMAALFHLRSPLPYYAKIWRQCQYQNSDRSDCKLLLSFTIISDVYRSFLTNKIHLLSSFLLSGFQSSIGALKSTK